MRQALIYTAHTPADIFHFSTSHLDKTSAVSHRHMTASFRDPIHLICRQAGRQAGAAAAAPAAALYNMHAQLGSLSLLHLKKKN